MLDYDLQGNAKYDVTLHFLVLNAWKPSGGRGRKKKDKQRDGGGFYFF